MGYEEQIRIDDPLSQLLAAAGSVDPAPVHGVERAARIVAAILGVIVVLGLAVCVAVAIWFFFTPQSGGVSMAQLAIAFFN
jgi:hypothetical protein